MARKFLYVPLTEGSLNLRGHYRETTPPALVGGKNFYYSSSDLALTIRPDIEATSESHVGFAHGIGGTDADKEDYINAAHGVYGTTEVAFISKVAPYTTSSTDGPRILCSTYNTGNVTVNSGSASVAGTDTLWLQNVWAGCLIYFAESTTPYRIIAVNSDTSLTLHTTVGTTYTSSNYSIYRVHSFDHANYKANASAFTNNIIYSTPNITLPIDETQISGPFFTSTARTETQFIYDWVWSAVTGLTAPSGTVSPQYTSGYSIHDTFVDTANPIVLYNFSSHTGTNSHGQYCTINSAAAVLTWRTIPDGDSGWSMAGWTGKVARICGFPTNDYLWILSRDGTSSAATANRILRRKDHTSTTGSNFYSIAYNNSGNSTTGFLLDTIHDICSCYNSTGTEQIIIAVGYDSNGGQSYQLTKSVDGGNNFSRIQVDNNASTAFYKIAASTVNPGHLMAIGTYRGTGSTVSIYNSSDFGENWTRVSNTSLGFVPWYGNLENSLPIVYDTDTDAFYVKEHPSSSGDSIWKSPWNSGTSSYGAAGTWTELPQPSVWPTISVGNMSTVQAMISAASNTSALISYDGFATVSTVGNADYIDQLYSVSCGGYGSPASDIILMLGKKSTSWNIWKGTYTTTVIPGQVFQTIAPFNPLSDTYRALTHAPLEGYVIIGHTREYEADDAGVYHWVTHPRRIRWTAPGEVNNFDIADGAGASDLAGTGSILDMRTVGNKIIVFETSQIGTISPRGYIDNPFEYDIIRENIRLLSNPVVVGRGDTSGCFFIANDGLLYSTNGITVDVLQTGFDATIFKDFDFSRPIWLDYSEELNSLISFYPGSSGTSHIAYTINIENGAVGCIELLDQYNKTTSVIVDSVPKSICCISHSDDKRTLLGYSKYADYQNLCVGQLDTDSAITGTDTIATIELGAPLVSKDTVSTAKWVAELETGIIQPEDELEKFILHDVILNVYNATEAAYVKYAVWVRSIEDTEWHNIINTELDNFSIDVSGGITGTAGTTMLMHDTAHRTGVILGSGTGSSASYTSPWLYEQASYYSESGAGVFAALTTTKTGSKTFTTTAPNGYSVWAFSMSAPHPAGEAGDLLFGSEQIGDSYTLPGDRYRNIYSVANSYTGTILTPYPKATMSVRLVKAEGSATAGEQEVAYPIQKLVTLPRFKIICSVGSTSATTVSKILGFTLVYTPAGERKLS